MATTLNRSFLTEIRNRLNNQGITSDDFHIIQEQKARRINLNIYMMIIITTQQLKERALVYQANIVQVK